MPSQSEYNTSLIFLDHPQATDFAVPTKTTMIVTDGSGIDWSVVAGLCDADEESYGLFNGGRLAARLKIVAPQNAGNDCPTLLWSVGKIEVLNAHQGQGLGPGLMDAVFAFRGKPLASDLDQHAGGADLWKRWIKLHPGKIELHDADGASCPVLEVGGRYAPDPWAVRETRLVRLP